MQLLAEAQAASELAKAREERPAQMAKAAAKAAARYEKVVRSQALLCTQAKAKRLQELEEKAASRREAPLPDGVHGNPFSFSPGRSSLEGKCKWEPASQAARPEEKTRRRGCGGHI